MVTTLRVWLSFMFCCWKTRSLIVRTPFIRRAQTLVSPVAAVADNAGIRLLPTVHPSLIALWKVSNVAIFEGIVLHRAASEPVSVWIKHHHHQQQQANIPPTILFPATLSASISGIVLAAVSDDIVVHFTRIEYVGVLAYPVAIAMFLQEQLQTSINHAMNDHHNDKKTTAAVTATPTAATAVISTNRDICNVSSSISVEVKVVQSSASGTHHGLHLVRFSLMGSRLPPSLSQSSPIPKKESRPPVGSVSASAFASPIPQDATSIVERLLTGCLMAKAPCVMDGKTPLMSLVEIEVLVDTTDFNHNNNNAGHSDPSSGLKTSRRSEPPPDPSPLPGSSPSPCPVAVVKVTQEVPVKFTKYMRRESILHTRLTSNDQQEQDTATVVESTATIVAATTATTTTTTATEATFMGLSLLVPADALRPRPSR